MSLLVQNICKLSNSIFSQVPRSSNSWDEALSKFKHLFAQMSIHDLYLNANELASQIPPTINLRERYPSAPCSYVSVFENEIFSLTVFCLRRRGSHIPIHDHPGMFGFLKCIYGAVTILSFTIIKDEKITIPQEIKNKVDTRSIHSIVPAIFMGEETISSDSRQICSFEPIERNLHLVRPAMGHELAVISDIITPPYTDNTNSYFYQKLGARYDHKRDQTIFWLLQTPDSGGFYCDTVQYCGPRISV